MRFDAVPRAWNIRSSKKRMRKERGRERVKERERGGSVMYSHTFAIAGFWYLLEWEFQMETVLREAATC